MISIMRKNNLHFYQSMFDDEENFENTDDRLEKIPLYKKGLEILDLVRQIADLISDDGGNELSSVKHRLLEDAYMLTVKIAAAEAGDLYDIRMENAAIIRKSAMRLMIQNHSLKMFGFEYVEYFQMVRDLIEEYRLLFIDWVERFDKSNYIIDRWGLFNPPGVGPFDVDINDIIGDKNNSFFDEFFGEDDEE